MLRLRKTFPAKTFPARTLPQGNSEQREQKPAGNSRSKWTPQISEEGPDERTRMHECAASGTA